MLPNVSHSNSSAMAHVPVLAAEVSQLLELRPGDTVIDCTFGAGGHAALLEPQLGAEGTYVAIDRDPDAKRYFDAFAAKATARTRFVRGNFALALRNLAATGTQRRRGADGPRHLLDAGRPAGARVLVRRRCAARHADGSRVRADRRRGGQRVGRAGDRPGAGAVRRGAVRAADRPGDRPPPGDGAVRAHRRPGRRDQVGDPDAQPLRPGPPGEALVPGAADRGQRRARVAPRGPRQRARGARGPAAGWPSSPSTRWRTGSSSGSSATAPAAAPARRSSRSACAATSRCCAR